MLSWGLGPGKYECLKAITIEAIVGNPEAEWGQMQDYPKDQGDELTKINLAKE